MHKYVKNAMVVLLMISVLLIPLQPQTAIAGELKGTPYTYTNDGDCTDPDNKIDIKLSGNIIKIRASVIWRKNDYFLAVAKKFKIAKKLKKYEYILDCKYKGTVNRKAFVKDLQMVHDHEWGGCIFYVKKGKIIGYELYG